MSITEIRVPEMGDFKDVAVIELHIKPGDIVAIDQTLIVLESDKASIDVPVALRRAHRFGRARHRPARFQRRADRHGGEGLQMSARPGGKRLERQRHQRHLCRCRMLCRIATCW
jgi:hypothetical protein